MDLALSPMIVKAFLRQLRKSQFRSAMLSEHETNCPGLPDKDTTLKIIDKYQKLYFDLIESKRKVMIISYLL